MSPQARHNNWTSFESTKYISVISTVAKRNGDILKQRIINSGEVSFKANTMSVNSLYIKAIFYL